MQDRRAFLTRSLAATLAIPMATSPQDAADHDLLSFMEKHLTQVLGDPALASTEAAHIHEICFHWAAPDQPAASFKTIVAYSFGNRTTPSTTPKTLPEPGPVNEELADTVHRLWQQNHAAVYAQWEIAHFLKTKHNLTSTIAIDPVIASDGTITYLSTDGVVEAVVKHKEGNAAALGMVGVVAHRDHAKRCVLTSRARGMDAWVAKDLSLPVTYDPNSGQPWTRSRDLYLIHDMAAQFAQLRAEQIAKRYPNG